jgi:ATP-dependent RNA helicase DeaD
MSFASINPSLHRALVDKGYAEPTPVQTAMLQADGGRDLIVSAQTGSGKTVAYGLALAPTLLGDAERFEAPASPLALIVAPTRELAMQVQRELIWLYGHAGARVAASIGGMDARREARNFEDGCHFVVGTPGRLRDHIERGRLDLTRLRGIVLDEADEMLNLGFREDLEFILDATPPERRTLLFSATMPREIAALAKRYQRDALRIDTVDKSQPHSDIDYRAMAIAANEVEHAIVNILRLFEAPAALIFCQTREGVRHLHASLVERGFAAVALSGELSQNERTHALQALRDGRARACVATDVAARGIDLPGLELVIHADLPNDRETLLHRSGRTGRAGRKGLCILLAPYARRRRAEALIAQAGVDALWEAPPSAEAIRIADQKRLLQNSVFSEPVPEEDAQLATLLLEAHGADVIARAFVRSLRDRLPAPEDLFVKSARSERSAGDARERAHPKKRERVRPDKREREISRREGFAPAGEAVVDRSYSPRTQEPMVWFRMNVGRSNKADPKWILPVICRLGDITKNEVGVIKISEDETNFEIVESAAPKFAANVRRASGEESVHIQPAAGALRQLRRSGTLANDGTSPSSERTGFGKPPKRHSSDLKKPGGDKGRGAGDRALRRTGGKGPKPGR